MNLEQFTTAELEADFTPVLAVPDNEAYIQRGARLSDDIRKKIRCSLDVPYGETPLQKLDIFPAENPYGPVIIFIHGGYWYSLDKSDYSYVAGPLVAAGASTVLINYDLCPEVMMRWSASACRLWYGYIATSSVALTVHVNSMSLAIRLGRTLLEWLLHMTGDRTAPVLLYCTSIRG